VAEHLHRRRREQPQAQCPKVGDKALNEMITTAWAQGWWCEKTGSGHVMCYPPDRGRMVLVASTPSDHRTIPNTRSALRRSGLII